MKLDYNIVWIEDKIDSRPFKACIETIKTFITNEFFNCNVQTARDTNNFKLLFENKLDYDLIITDLSLNDGTTGKDVINYIRENKHNHTEIFFYSANTQLRNTDLINSNRITFYQLTEGNYRELSNEISDLIKLTISKFQHIVTMRGMIMHETSSLDVEMMELLEKIIIKKGSEKIISVIKEKYKETNSQFNNDIESLIEIPSILQKIGSEHRWRAIVRNIDKDEIKTVLENYKKEIIDERNRFAHAVLETDETGRSYFKNKQDGIDFNDIRCKEIRKNIIKHKQNLYNLRAKF